MNKILILALVTTLPGSSFYYYFKTNFHTVIPDKFYRSAQLDAETLSAYITDHNIATVVNLRGANPKNDWYIDEKKITSKLNVKHVDIKLTAYDQPKINRVKEIIEVFQSLPQPILFHCKRGADRSGLVGAIVLLLEGKQSLADIEKQVSWRYFAIEHNSTGKLFIAQYRQWLQQHQVSHTPEAFVNWLDKDYVDDQGNLLYTLEQINGVIVTHPDDEDLPTFNLDRSQDNQLKITGWTINHVGQTVAQDVKILLNHNPLSKMKTGISRPDVAKYFGHPGFTRSGWTAVQAVNEIENGCHDVQLVLSRAIDKSWTSDPKARVCING